MALCLHLWIFSVSLCWQWRKGWGWNSSFTGISIKCCNPGDLSVFFLIYTVIWQKRIGSWLLIYFPCKNDRVFCFSTKKYGLYSPLKEHYFCIDRDTEGIWSCSSKTGFLWYELIRDGQVTLVILWVMKEIHLFQEKKGWVSATLK